MGAWKRICCPVDFSRESRAALETAADLAWRCEAVLTVVHVRAPPEGAGEGLASRDAREMASLEIEGQLGSWIEAAERICPGPILPALLTGDPAQEIVGLARDGACDVIVMGTHARGERDRLVLGSVAAAVVRDAPCTVVVVRDRPGRPSDVLSPR